MLNLISIIIFLIGVSRIVVVAEESTPTLCPPQKLILPCRCSQKLNEIQVWCSHSDLPRVLNGIKSAAKFIEKPIDELILENNQLPSLPSRFFSPLRIVRLMLRNNGVERLATGWLADLESSLVEIFIVERTLRSLPFDSLIECKKLEAVTIQSDHLKRAPSFNGLYNLRYIKIEGNELMELPPYGFVDLHTLENVYINSSPKLNRLEAGLFQNLDQVNSLNFQGNGISWIHLRAFTNLPTVKSIDLSRNEISDAGMIGRTIKDLPKLEILRLENNFITTLAEGTFVDLQYLKELYLNGNAIAEIHHGAFHKTPNLKLVHLEHNFLSRVHPESFLQTSGSGVEYLHLQYNEIANIEEVKSLLDALPMLKFLDLSYNKLDIIPFGSLRGHGSLEQLCLDHNYIARIERDAFMAMPGLRELRLKNNSLTENTPLPFWNLPGLKGLDLSDNKISFLNETLLVGLPSLRRLDLSNNELYEIEPNSFANNIFLETINISMNVINDIHPATFRYLNRLFEIDASFNSLKDMIPGLPRIVERVNIEGNKISMMPSTSTKLLDLPNLRMLNMGGNLLNKLPKNVFQTLYQLRSLSLAQNRLRSIDEHSFNGLGRLEILNLQENGLVALHERGFSPLKELRDLNVKGNRLEVLTESFSENELLERFDASNNNIMEIAAQTFGNTRLLQTLDLSHNGLKQLPPSLATLAELRDVDISYNRLTVLPSEIITQWRKIEMLKASNNKVTELPQNAFIDLPELQYLDLSSNELKIVNTGSVRNLPVLQELVLADNVLVELGEKSLEDLPSLQALHLQNNYLRYISPKSLHHTSSVVYLNLSYNNFENMEHMGLRSVRNLEVLDVSGNKIRRIATNPLRNLDWLVELKLDDNHICKVQGEPFSSMPRLKVLTMRNNRMVNVIEPTFRSLRANLAVLDLDGNPLECSCNILWLRAWYQESNSHPGPRCRDGNLLTEMRVSKNDCETSNDSRMNQVLLTNEHGDVFKRQINIDECDMDLPSYNGENGHIPSSPVESEYFYEQYIDYPLNDTAFEQTVADASFENRNHNVTQSPFSKNPNPIRNDTVLNYDQHKLQQLHNHNNKDSSSSFTFFGVPLPSITSLWNGRDISARKSNSRADIDANGKSRLRNFRLRPGEFVDSFQFSNNIHATSSQKPATIPAKENGEPTNIHPPLPSFPHSPNHITEFPSIANTYYHHQQRLQPQQPYNDPRIEKGGFVPMVPDHRKGFTPIRNPFANETEPSEDAQETVSTELRPNVNLEYSESNGEDEAERKYSILVPTVSPSSTTERGQFQQSQFNVSSLRKGEITGPTKSANGISLIHTTTPDGTSTIYRPTTVTRTTIATTGRPITTQNAENVFNESQNIRPNIQKIYSSTTSRGTAHTTTLRPNTITGSSTPFYPTFMPNSTDTINLSKNAVLDNNGSVQEKNALSALVAPGAQQSSLRTSPGRSVITKVFNNNVTNAPNPTPTSIPSSSTTIQTTKRTTKQPITTITTNKLPAAEEYLRTTSRNNYIKENTAPIAASHSTKIQTVNDLNDDETIHQKNDMEWYYNNYNKSTWKEPQMDPGLYRFRSNSISSLSIYQIKLHSTILISALVLTTTHQFTFFVLF